MTAPNWPSNLGPCFLDTDTLAQNKPRARDTITNTLSRVASQLECDNANIHSLFERLQSILQNLVYFQELLNEALNPDKQNSINQNSPLSSFPLQQEIFTIIQNLKSDLEALSNPQNELRLIGRFDSDNGFDNLDPEQVKGQIQTWLQTLTQATGMLQSVLTLSRKQLSSTLTVQEVLASLGQLIESVTQETQKLNPLDAAQQNLLERVRRTNALFQTLKPYFNSLTNEAPPSLEGRNIQHLPSATTVLENLLASEEEDQAILNHLQVIVNHHLKIANEQGNQAFLQAFIQALISMHLAAQVNASGRLHLLGVFLNQRLIPQVTRETSYVLRRALCDALRESVSKTESHPLQILTATQMILTNRGLMSEADSIAYFITLALNALLKKTDLPTELLLNHLALLIQQVGDNDPLFHPLIDFLAKKYLYLKALHPRENQNQKLFIALNTLLLDAATYPNRAFQALRYYIDHDEGQQGAHLFTAFYQDFKPAAFFGNQDLTHLQVYNPKAATLSETSSSSKATKKAPPLASALSTSAQAEKVAGPTLEQAIQNLASCKRGLTTQVQVIQLDDNDDGTSTASTATPAESTGSPTPPPPPPLPTLMNQFGPSTENPKAAPPPPPPPPPPSGSAPPPPPKFSDKKPTEAPSSATPKLGNRGGLLAQIQAGPKLKRVDTFNAAPPPEGRGGLLAQIQAGKKLKSAKDREVKQNPKPQSPPNLAQEAMAQRKNLKPRKQSKDDMTAALLVSPTLGLLSRLQQRRKVVAGQGETSIETATVENIRELLQKHQDQIPEFQLQQIQRAFKQKKNEKAVQVFNQWAETQNNTNDWD